VSLNPRKVPCAASAITIGGAPKALQVRNCSAGTRIGESYNISNLIKHFPNNKSSLITYNIQDKIISHQNK